MPEPSDRPKTEPVSAAEREKILAEVLEDQRARKEARARQPRPPGADAPFFAQVGLLFGGTLFFYLLFFSPSWIAPAAAPPIRAERVEDNLRVYLSIVAPQIDAYETREGRLPETIERLPGVREGTEYVPISSGDYRIAVSSDGVAVTYESSQDLTEFAGMSTDRVMGAAVGDAARRGET